MRFTIHRIHPDDRAAYTSEEDVDTVSPRDAFRQFAQRYISRVRRGALSSGLLRDGDVYLVLPKRPDEAPVTIVDYMGVFEWRKPEEFDIDDHIHQRRGIL